MENLPKAQQIYRHFKGNLYQIVTLAEHTETGELLVVYQALYGEFKVYARPLSLFMGKTDKEKYPEATQEYRFMLWSGSEEGKAMKEVKAVKAEETGIDPLVLEFLDARTYEERLNILTALHHRITDDMITTMAVAMDVEVGEGDVEERYAALHQSLLLFDKFECNRLR